MIAEHPLVKILKTHSPGFYPVVPFNKISDNIARLDLSPGNTSITPELYNDMDKFTAFIEKERQRLGASYLLGGYGEHREMYRRSELFDKNLLGPGSSDSIMEEPRCIHLGVDIWGLAGTKVFAVMEGMVHSVAYNNHFGDYGATIILQHQLDAIPFYTLYGHLSLKDIENKKSGQFIARAEPIAHFGGPEENGHWPPHLHFQVITDIGEWEGDYPGVCKKSEMDWYLHNCPDPAPLLPF